jgi:hypothetical protein
MFELQHDQAHDSPGLPLHALLMVRARWDQFTDDRDDGDLNHIGAHRTGRRELQRVPRAGDPKCWVLGFEQAALKRSLRDEINCGR